MGEEVATIPIRLSQLEKQTGWTQDELLQSAISGDIILSVFFEGVLLKTPDIESSFNRYQDVSDEKIRLITDEMWSLVEEGKIKHLKRGGEKFHIHNIYKGLMQVPLDDILEIMARGKAKLNCLNKDNKQYRCHAMPLPEFRLLRQDQDRMRELREGKTTPPEYFLSDLFITSEEAEKIQPLVTPICTKNPDTSQDEILWTWSKMRKFTGLDRKTIENRAKRLEIKLLTNGSGHRGLKESDLRRIVNNN